MSDTPLRIARVESGKTLETVARSVGVSKGYLSRVECGLQRPSPTLTEKLSRFFGTVSEIEILYPERFTK